MISWRRTSRHPALTCHLPLVLTFSRTAGRMTGAPHGAIDWMMALTAATAASLTAGILSANVSSRAGNGLLGAAETTNGSR